MRGSLLIGLAVAGLLLAFSPALQAADQPLMNPPERQPALPDTNNPGMMQQEPMAAVHVLRATDVIGLEVRGLNNENLGKIDNLAIDGTTGQIRYAVVSFGSTLGIGGKLLPVPWQALKCGTPAHKAGETVPVAKFAVLNVDKEALDKAPSFKTHEWPDFSDQRWITSIDQFYRPYLAKRSVKPLTR
jgi:hypothetical protein